MRTANLGNLDPVGGLIACEKSLRDRNVSTFHRKHYNSVTHLQLVPTAVRQRALVELHGEALEQPNRYVAVSEAQALAHKASDVVDADLVGSLVARNVSWRAKEKQRQMLTQCSRP